MPPAQKNFQNPGSPGRATNYPENFEFFTFEGFDGLNTKASRPAIKDQQCFWMDNWMPLGENNARTLYDIGTALFTGATISFFAFVNISDTTYALVFKSDGSIVSVLVSSGAATVIAPVGTIVDPTQTIGVTQFGPQYVSICAPQPNGYFIWDGTLFYKSGTVGPVVSVAYNGAGYTGPPSPDQNGIKAITGVSGRGTNATFSASVTSAGSFNAINAITITSAGTGFNALDVVNIAFRGGAAGQITAIAFASLTAGKVTNVSIADPGTGYGAGTLVSFQGGGGVGAAGTCTASNTITAVTITNPGQGYITAPTVIFTDTNNAVARAAAAVMPFGLQGTAVETYANRVWLANGHAPTTPPPKNLEVFSAPSNPADFNTADGAGAFLENDSFLRTGIHALKQSNGFLYEIGDSSVEYISGVQTTGNPPVTTFSNQNIDPQVGSPWPNTVQVFGRAIVFANTFGVHALYGGAVQKVSLDLDGIYSSVTPTGTGPRYSGLEPSAAVAVIFGIHVYILLLPIIDQLTGSQRNALLMWDGKKWWTASQSVSLKQIGSLEINSVLTAYGTDGTHLYPLFQTPSTAITKTIRSKFWDTPSYLMKKRAQLLYGVLQSQGATGAVQVAIETETQSQTTSIPSVFGVNWTTATGDPVSWTTSTLDTVVWQGTGISVFQYRTPDVAGFLFGMTLTTSATDLTLISLLLTGQQYSVKT